jgi:hypothetical protein
VGASAAARSLKTSRRKALFMSVSLGSCRQRSISAPTGSTWDGGRGCDTETSLRIRRTSMDRSPTNSARSAAGNRCGGPARRSLHRIWDISLSCYVPWLPVPNGIDLAQLERRIRGQSALQLNRQREAVACMAQHLSRNQSSGLALELLYSRSHPWPRLHTSAVRYCKNKLSPRSVSSPRGICEQSQDTSLRSP